MKKLLLLISAALFIGTTIIYYSCKKKETNTNETIETCSDGIKNQGETDIDCGGPCAPCQISTFINLVVGGGSSIGYYFITAQNGHLYKISEGNANQASIDLIYYWSAADAETICSPDDAIINTITSFGVNNWTTKNQTRFKSTTLTLTDFQNVTTKNELINAANGANQSEVDNLHAGDVKAFVTHTGKSGLFYVVSRDLASSSITISMKVEN
jgi:hypothetical protein